MFTEPAELLVHWEWAGEATVEAADSGLINASWVVRVEGEPEAVLQRLNTTIFDPCVHEDIEGVTAHLAAQGFPTPRLRRTSTGCLWHEDGEGGAWRVLDLVGTETVHKLRRPARARSAGHLIGRFHRAVGGLDWSFRSVRPGAHDTPGHLARMRAALAAHPDHRLQEAIAPIAEAIEARWARWKGPSALPRRIIHGDLKISNVRFDGDEAVALIDLDTFQWGTLDAELGDALRSWCNPAAYGDPAPRFDLRIFDAAIQGYTAAEPDLTEEEWASLVPGIERICLELAARFARDALEESYFAWDPHFGGPGEHNLLRARHQLDLARTVAHAAPHAQRKLDEARRR